MQTHHHYHQQQDRDDSIPLPTQHYMAEYLSPLSSPPFPSSSNLKTLFVSNGYINQKFKILGRTTIRSSTPTSLDTSRTCSSLDPRTRPPRSFLQYLPQELFCKIREYLAPADLICLGLASRDLFHTINFQLVDLRNLCFAGGEVWDVLHERKLRGIIMGQRFEVTRRLDRDEVERLEGTRFWKRGGGEEMACGVCVKMHRKSWFSKIERGERARERRCLAAEAKVKICEHWSEDLVSLRRMRAEMFCERKGGGCWGLKKCEHADHTSNENNGLGEPHMMDLGSGWAIDRSLVLMRSPSRDLITKGILQEALRYRADVEICPHVRLGDPKVLDAFEKRSKMRLEEFPDHLLRPWFHLPEFESTSCKKCGRAWQFSMFDHGKRDSSLRYALRLSVGEQLFLAREPWSEEWLNRVEEADSLRSIKGMV